MTRARLGDVISQLLMAIIDPFLDGIAGGHEASSADADDMKTHELKLGKAKRHEDADSRAGNEDEKAGHEAFRLDEEVDGLH